MEKRNSQLRKFSSLNEIKVLNEKCNNTIYVSRASVCLKGETILDKKENQKKKLLMKENKRIKKHPGPILYLDAISRNQNNVENKIKDPLRHSLSLENKTFALNSFTKEWCEAENSIFKGGYSLDIETAILGIFEVLGINCTEKEISQIIDFGKSIDGIKDLLIENLFKNSNDLNFLSSKWLCRKKPLKNKELYTFSPKISKTSEILAGKRGTVSQRINSPKKRFSPEPKSQTNCFTSPKRENFDPIQKSISLYEDGVRKALKFDKNTSEIEWEKNKNECTFTPKIKLLDSVYSSKQNSDFSKVFSYSKSESKYFERMKDARIYKQIIQELRSKGVTPSEKVIRKLKNLAEENEPLIKLSLHESGNFQINEPIQRQPILAVDVNIDESNCDKLIIFEDDDPYKLVEEFSQKHNLSEEMTDKLLILLRVQLNSILSKIDEEDEN